MNYNGSNYADLLNTSTVNADEVIIGNLILPNLDPNSVPYIDVNNSVQDRVLTNGQLLIGQSGGPPLAASLTGTADEIIVTNGPGSITLSTPQPIATTSSPTFANVTTTNLYEATNGYTLIGPGAPATNSYNVCSDNNLNGTNNSIVVGDNSLVNIRPKAAFCDLGSTGAPFQTIHLSGNVHGVTYNRAADDIISCSTSQTTDNLVSFAGSQKVIKDTGISASTGPWLPLAGGTMSGNIDMGTQAIDNCSAFQTPTDSSPILVGSSTYSFSPNTTVVGSVSSSFSPNTTILGGSSSIDSSSSNSVSLGYGNTIQGSTSALVVGSNSTVISGASESVVVGHNSSSTKNNCVVIGANNSSSAVSAHCIGSSLVNGTAGSLIVDATSNIRTNNTTCDLGTVTSRFKDAHLSGSLVGSVKTSAVNSIVTGPASAITGDLCSYSDATGKIISDSGIVASNVVTASTNLVSGDLVTANGTKTVNDSGIVAANVVTASTNLVSGNLVTANGTKTVNNGGIVAANVVTNAGTSTNSNICSFNGTTGKVIQDSSIASSNVVQNTGGTTTSGQVATFSGTTGRLVTNSTTPILGTPASGTLTNCTGLPISTGVSGLGSGVATMLGNFSSANIAAACTDETGFGPLVFANQPDFFAPKSSGLPLTVSYATQYDAWTVSGTTSYSFFPIASSSGSVITSGNVTFPASSTTPGSVLKVRAWCQLNSWSAGGTITLRCGANGNYISLLVPSTTPVNGYIMAEWDITVRNYPNFRGQGILFGSGQAPVISDGNGTWNSNISNNLVVQVLFSVASGGNMVSGLSANVICHFPW